MKKILILSLFILFGSFQPVFAIKIGLQTEVSSTSVGTSVKGTIIDVNTNKTICDLDAMRGYEIKPYHSIMAIRYEGTYYKIESDKIVIKPTSAGFISAKGKKIASSATTAGIDMFRKILFLIIYATTPNHVQKASGSQSGQRPAQDRLSPEESHLYPHFLSQNAGGLYQQNQNQYAVADCVGILGRRKVGLYHGLRYTQDYAPQHGYGN